MNGSEAQVFREEDPVPIPWAADGFSYPRGLPIASAGTVCESTGVFTAQEKDELHLKEDAKRLSSLNPEGRCRCTIFVVGDNHENCKTTETVVPNASCMTNGLALVLASP